VVGPKSVKTGSRISLSAQRQTVLSERRQRHTCVEKAFGRFIQPEARHRPDAPPLVTGVNIQSLELDSGRGQAVGLWRAAERPKGVVQWTSSCIQRNPPPGNTLGAGRALERDNAPAPLPGRQGRSWSRPNQSSSCWSAKGAQPRPRSLHQSLGPSRSRTISTTEPFISLPAASASEWEAAPPDPAALTFDPQQPCAEAG